MGMGRVGWVRAVLRGAMKSTSEGRNSGQGAVPVRKWEALSKSSVAVFILLSIGVCALWIYALSGYRQRQLDDAFASLRAIADLKVEELMQWRHSHLDYGESLMRNPATAGWVSSVVESPRDGAARQEAVMWMQGLMQQYDFLDVVLVNPELDVVLASSSSSAAISPGARAGLRKAFDHGAAELSDLHVAPQAQETHLDLYVPIYRGQGKDRIPVGAFLFRIDPGRMLYPVVRSWPLRDESGECLLVRREGHEVVYLNRLRTGANAPLALRTDLSATNFPAALAVLGMEGPVEGLDYRGAAVLAVNQPVPGTGWWLTVKKDRQEIMAALRPLELLLTLTGVALINLALFAFGFSIYRQRKALTLARAREESERFALSRHYLNLAKYANDIILLTDERQKVIEANERALHSYGYTRGGMLALPFKALWPANRRGDCAQALRRTEHEHAVTIETVHCRADGSTFPVEVSLRAIDESGVKWTQAVVRDITERIQRRLFFDRYQALCRNARDIILFVDKTGAILDANEAAERAYEYTREELTRLRIHDIRAASHVDGVDEQLAKAASDGVLFETAHRTKSGRVFPVEVNAAAVTIGGERIILGIIRDITQRKRVEQALISSEQNLKHIMDVVPQVIYARDEGGRIMLVNRRFAEMAGKTQEELTGGVQTAFTEQCRGADADVLRSGKPAFIPEETWTEDDGTIHTMQTTKTVFVPSGQSRPAVLSVSTDISESKQLQAQLLHAQKMESVGRLAGGIAHDFNNLLQAIQGFNEILMNRMDDDDPGRQDAMEIAKAAKRAGILTKQLLAYSRRQVMDPQVRDLNAIIDGALAFLKRLMGETIQMAVNLDAETRPVRVDTSQIEQVLMNLVVNARDAMPSGGRITISTTAVRLTEADVLHIPDAHAGSFVCLSVGDTGMGISEEILPHIFEPFFTTKGLGSGTGLGLAMVYGIVKQHGGWVTVYSQLKMGTIFRLYFPVADQPVESEGHHEEQPMAPDDLRMSRILVVEDEDMVRQFAARALKDRGFLVYSSRTVAEAMETFTEQRGAFDLVFTDVVLPDGNGVDLAKAVRSRKPDVRLLFTSGYMDVRDRWPEIVDQQWLFLQKPYPVAPLIENVIAALKATSHDAKQGRST